MSRCSRSPSPHSASTLLIDVPVKTDTSFPDDDMPVQSKGGYAIDFDNLDSMNPFQSSSKIILSPPKPAALLSDTLTETAPSASSPAPEEVEKVTEKADMALDETLLFIPSVENSLAELSADGASADSTVIIEPRKMALADHSTDDTENVEVPEAVPIVKEDVTDPPLLPKGSYQIDFDNLDSVNPFKTGGSKIENSPPVSRKSLLCNSAPSQAEEMSSGLKTSEAPSKQEDKLSTTEKPSLTEVNTDTTAPSLAPPKEVLMVLEFDFDDGAEVKCKPPPKRLGLKPPLSKTKAKAREAEKKSPEIKPKSCDVAAEIPPARGAYTIDFNQFDDPNFNPFGTSTKMGSSPPRGAPVVSEVSMIPEQLEKQESTEEKQAHRSVRGDGVVGCLVCLHVSCSVPVLSYKQTVYYMKSFCLWKLIMQKKPPKVCHDPKIPKSINSSVLKLWGNVMLQLYIFNAVGL